MILHPSLNPEISCVNPLLVSGMLLLVLQNLRMVAVFDFNNSSCLWWILRQIMNWFSLANPDFIRRKGFSV